MEPTQAPLFPFLARSDPNELLLQEHLNRAIPYESDYVSAMPKPLKKSHKSQRFEPYPQVDGGVGSEGPTASTSDLVPSIKKLTTKEEDFLKSAQSYPKFEATIEPATHMVLKFKDITIKVLRRPTTRKEDRLGYEFFIDGVNGGKSLGKLDYETLRTFHEETKDEKLQSLWHGLMVRLVGSLCFTGDLRYIVHVGQKGICYTKEDVKREKICREDLSQCLPEGWDFYFVYPEDHQMTTMEEHIKLAESVEDGPAEVIDNKYEKIKYSLSEGSAFPNYEIIVYRILPSQRATVVFGRDFGYPNIFYKLPYLDIEGIMKLLKEKVD
eukprot:GHVP01055009.1.p1 GENE.GHVP01055009.1~~GHVP01055009.1.p1  ORF type:complete len:361 (-),score=60.09 GHVP01055009.1:91-1065(-)